MTQWNSPVFSDEEMDQFAARWAENMRQGRNRAELLDPLPLRVRARLTRQQAITNIGIWLCDRKMWWLARVLWWRR